MLRPASAQVQQGIPYRFEVGHCGLEHVVDFDGSFWESVAEERSDDVRALFSRDRGVITLESADRATYMASGGEAITLRRLEGAQTFGACQ